MAELSEEIKTFVVQRLAQYETPTQVVEAVKATYDVEVSRQAVHTYDPERAGKKPAEKWRALHAAHRKQFLADVAKIGIAQQAVRLRHLERLLSSNPRNPAIQLQILKQAAEEIGGSYTNARVLSGPNGGPVETLDRTPPVPVDQRAARVLELLGAAAARVGAAA